MMSREKEHMKEYIDAVTNVLMSFQYIEVALRSYISLANEKIKDKLNGTIPFKYDNEWIKKDSLGTLIDKFSKVNNNKDLINSLGKLTRDRNQIAHQGFLLTTEQESDVLYKAFAINELKRLGEQLHVVFLDILGEIKRIGII